MFFCRSFFVPCLYFNSFFHLGVLKHKNCFTHIIRSWLQLLCLTFFRNQVEITGKLVAFLSSSWKSTVNEQPRAHPERKTRLSLLLEVIYCWIIHGTGARQGFIPYFQDYMATFFFSFNCDLYGINNSVRYVRPRKRKGSVKMCHYLSSTQIFEWFVIKVVPCLHSAVHWSAYNTLPLLKTRPLPWWMGRMCTTVTVSDSEMEEVSGFSVNSDNE